MASTKGSWKKDGVKGKKYSKLLFGLRWYAKLNSTGEIKVSYKVETVIEGDGELDMALMLQPAGKWEDCHAAFQNMGFGKEGLYPPTDPTFDSKAPTLKLGHARLFDRVLKERFPSKQFTGLTVKKESDIWAAVLPKLKDCESYDSMVKRISKATGAKPLSF